MPRNRLAHDTPYEDAQGYLRLRGRTVHRQIWEEANGPIPAGYIVHHLNEDKQDNRLENLELQTRADHARHHWAGKRQTQQHISRCAAALAPFFAKGGPIMSLSPEARSELGKRAAAVRWGKG